MKAAYGERDRTGGKPRGSFERDREAPVRRGSDRNTDAPARSRSTFERGAEGPARERRSFERDANAPARPPRPFARDADAAPRRRSDERGPAGKPPARRGEERGAYGAERPQRRFERDGDAPTRARRVAEPVNPDEATRSDASAVHVTHNDEPGTLRLSKRMSELGLCSRREADEWIEKGWVLVDGERIDTLGSKVRPDQHIEIVPAARQAQARQVTILLHKPVGYVSGQAEDGYEPAVTLVTGANHWEGDDSGVRFSPQHLRTLAPAGRLDIDSTGLLVLTQDGRIAKQLIGEHSDIDKEYLVRVTYDDRDTDIDQHFPAESLALLCHGLSLDDVPLKPALVSWQNGEQLRFVLREGKKRQIRRMCELVGLKVVGLKRVRMGRVLLGALPQGQWRYLAADEQF